MTKNMERINFELDPRMKAAIQSWAIAEDRSVGSILRRLIASGLEARTVKPERRVPAT
jgi:hypothetical protein